MPEELAYVLITPYSIRKSRTGGILGRLLSRSGLELVGGRMFAPSPALVEEFAAAVVTGSGDRHRGTQELISRYIEEKLSPDSRGTPQRALVLLLRGPDAVLKTRSVVGHIVNERTSGETIRDTYGDYLAERGEVVYFEPAVLAAPDEESALRHLALWAKYSDTDGGILEEAVPFAAGEDIETTLVLIKPDNFRFPNARPGGVIDLFSRTGLYLVGFKVHHMSVAQAQEFYRPVLDMLMDKLREPSSKRARLAVEEEFGVPIDSETERQLGDLLGPIAGRNHWENIVQFMSGTRPGQCPPDQLDAPGSEKCVALVYQGVNAVSKIREVLGPTDPSKAPSGTIRREFGQTIMINAAHASDSQENARREMNIINISENNFKPLIDSYLS